MSDTTAVVARYIEMWNEGDPDRRRALVRETMTEDGSYVDPLVASEGVEGIDSVIAGVQQQFPGHRFTLLSGPDTHHDRVRFSWSLAANGGDPIAVGIDFAIVAEDGRLRAVTGFLEPGAAA
jgi:hypothetical protein